MATPKVNYSELKALYELCTTGVDSREFFTQQGINYQKYQAWQRRRLWN